jgi:hypothetical protein
MAVHPRLGSPRRLGHRSDRAPLDQDGIDAVFGQIDGGHPSSSVSQNPETCCPVNSEPLHAKLDTTPALRKTVDEWPAVFWSLSSSPGDCVTSTATV